MTPSLVFVALIAMTVIAFWLGKSRSLAIVGGTRGVRTLHY
jgi:hypothetical protein